jgi:hypothetical protein
MDAQIGAIAITVLAVLAGSVFNNVRIGDVNIGLNRVTKLEGWIH